MNKMVFAMGLCALIVSGASAKPAQTFILEGDFVILTGLTEGVEREYADWLPGFSVAGDYLLTPVRFFSGGGRFSYTRARSAEQRDVSLNNLGMCAVARPQYETNTRLKTTPFVQICPGVYRMVSKDVNDLYIIKDTFFALELGAGVAIGSVEFGVMYNMGKDRKYSRDMAWLSVFFGLRMRV